MTPMEPTENDSPEEFRDPFFGAHEMDIGSFFGQQMRDMLSLFQMFEDFASEESMFSGEYALKWLNHVDKIWRAHSLPKDPRLTAPSSTTRKTNRKMFLLINQRESHLLHHTRTKEKKMVKCRKLSAVPPPPAQSAKPHHFSDFEDDSADSLLFCSNQIVW